MRITPSRRSIWNLSGFSAEIRGFAERRIVLPDGHAVRVARARGRGEGTGSGSGSGWGWGFGGGGSPLPLVLVAGLSGGWELLAPLARRLSRHHDVYIAGLRGDDSGGGGSGSGSGSGSGALTVRDYADDLASVIERLDLQRPAVMGVSFGGAVALEYAVSRPHGLSALVVQGAEAKFAWPMGARIARRVLERMELPRNSAFVNQFFRLLFGEPAEPGPLWDFVLERCWSIDQGELARRLRALESFDVRRGVGALGDRPTLVISGGKDVIVPPSRHRALAASIGRARYESIPGAGHIGFLTHSRAVGDRVSAVLSREFGYV